MKQAGDNTYRLKSGREFYANRWILGLAPDDDSLFHGYDGEAWIYESHNYSQEFTPEERKEIAEYMVRMWRAWGRAPSSRGGGR